MLDLGCRPRSSSGRSGEDKASGVAAVKRGGVELGAGRSGSRASPARCGRRVGVLPSGEFRLPEQNILPLGRVRFVARLKVCGAPVVTRGQTRPAASSTSRTASFFGLGSATSAFTGAGSLSGSGSFGPGNSAAGNFGTATLSTGGGSGSGIGMGRRSRRDHDEVLGVRPLRGIAPRRSSAPRSRSGRRSGSVCFRR